MLRVPWNALTYQGDAGDIIKADAETFDPDNKIIWRLHADTPVGEKGNWMYAPVRGPKTAVPLNEALLIYDKVLAVLPTNADTHHNRGNALYQAARPSPHAAASP